MGSLDRERFASSQRAKTAPPVETPSGAAAFVAPELPIRALNGHSDTPGASPGRVLTNGHTNGTATPSSSKQKFQIQPLSNVSPMSLAQENVQDIHLLTAEEIELCEKTRIHPKPYLVIKETVMKEALKGNGTMKRKAVRELTKIDSGKSARIFEFFIAHGWLGRA
jgi:transcriptional adapter 2-alpha